jgi:acyltransferase-like protein
MGKDSRRGDVDLIRALIVLGLVFFHSARIFDYLPNPVKNNQSSIVFMILVGFFSQWGMPLLFFVAGVATWYSLNRRTPAEFAIQRLRRLIVPLVFGVCVVIPPERYYTLLADPDYHESFREFFPKFFRVVFVPSFPRFIRPDPQVNYFDIGHLWFLLYLFAFSLIALPVFVYLRRDRGRMLASRLAEFCENKGAVLLLALPVIFIELFVDLGETIGWNRYSFLSFLILGYLFSSDIRFDRSARENSEIALIAGTLSVLAFFWASYVTWKAGVDPSHGFALDNVLWRLFKALSSWFWVVAIWGFAQRFRNRGPLNERDSTRHSLLGGIFRYGNEAVLPFYIIHDPVVVILAFYIVKWNASVTAKFVALSIPSVAVTLVIYEVFVRRINLSRFLFGMKPKKS